MTGVAPPLRGCCAVMPLDRVLGHAGTCNLAGDEPAVGIRVAPVVEENFAAQRFDDQTAQRVFRRHGEGGAVRQRNRAVRTVADAPHRSVGLLGEHTRRLSQVKRLAEERAGIQFQVEADFAFPFGRQRLGQIHGDAQALAFGPDAHAIADVRLLEVRRDADTLASHLPLADFGQRSPLARCGFQRTSPHAATRSPC